MFIEATRNYTGPLFTESLTREKRRRGRGADRSLYAVLKKNWILVFLSSPTPPLPFLSLCI